MKLLRLLLFSVAGVILLLGGLILLLTIPAVQTKLVSRLLNRRTDIKVQVGRVEVTWDRIELQQLQIQRADSLLTVPSATIELPVWDVTHRLVAIRQLRAKGWTLDFLHGSNAATPGAPSGAEGVTPAGNAAASAAVVGGILPLLQLPVDFSLEDADLEGVVLVKDPVSQTSNAIKVTMAGGHLDVGHEGSFTLSASSTLPKETDRSAKLTTRSTVQARMATKRSFDQLRIRGTTTATGTRFSHNESLEFSCDLSDGETGEKYHFTLRSLSEGTSKNLIELDGAFVPQSTEVSVSGTWKCDVRDTDLTSFTLGFSLPEFVAVGEGRFQADRAWNQIHAVGKIDVTAEKLEKIKPAFGIVGKIGTKTDFDLVQEGTRFRIERFNAELSADKPVAVIHTSQRFEFDAQTAQLKVADPTGPLVQLNLLGVPLKWFTPVLGDFSLTGQDLEGAFIVGAKNGGFAVRATSPAMIRQFTVARAGHPWTRPFDLSFTPEFDLSAQGWQTDVYHFELRGADAPFLAGALKLGQVAGTNQPIKAAGQFRVDLPVLAAQPLGVGLTLLTKGSGQGDFSASVNGGTMSIAAKLLFDELAVGDEPLPKLTADLRADLRKDGQVEAHLPIVIGRNGHASEIQLNAKMDFDGPTCRFDADLSGNSLMLDDVKPLWALAERKPSSESNDQPPKLVPFWSGFVGPVKFALKEMIFPEGRKVRNVAGTANFEKAKLGLENCHAALAEDLDLALNGAIAFSKSEPLPYDASANFTLTGFDPVPVLNTAEPNKLPTVDGKFEIAGKITADARSMSELGAHPKVGLKLNSRGGKFRGLDLGASAASLGKAPQGITSKLAGIVALGASVIGRGSATPAERAKAITESLRFLAEINYDQLSLELQCVPTEPISVRDFSLITPDVRITGSGTIGAVGGLTWAQQPLSLGVQVSVRGAQAENLKLLGLLKPEVDSLGYFPLVEKLQLDGTPANVGANSLAQLIQQKPSQ